MKRIAILGPGLLGGSIALNLRESGAAHVSLWARRQAAVDDILARGCADEASISIEKVAADADLVVMCVPIGAMEPLSQELRGVIRKEAIITDVGSVKQGVVAGLDRVFQEYGRFVGSHPMAGSEETGMAAARNDLFTGKTCIVTPSSHTDAAALHDVVEFWKQLGCKYVCQLSPEAHDECVGLVSHLPHLIAAALVNTVADTNAAAFEVVGPGFRDTTRVAGGPPAMWQEILTENSTAVLRALDAMIAKLTTFRQTLVLHSAETSKVEIIATLAAAQSTRDRIFPKKK